jgi:hypothetical protein
MFSIGEFARHGRVSVRMLRHYDAIGLIRPACVDAATGYRFYQASQLDELNRVIALKDLGFTLQDLPGVDSAAAIIHHGSMDDVLPAGQALARWIDANGYRSAGYAREVTLHWCPDPEQWVTELQQPIDTTGG